MNNINLKHVCSLLLLCIALMASPTWALTATEVDKLLASDGAAVDLFGLSVAISGDTAVIGAPYDDDRGFNSGSAYVFTRDTSGNWNEQAKLLASDGTFDDSFGWSVAVSGDTAVIGASWDERNGLFWGAAYVFTRDASGSWTQQARLQAGDGDYGNGFGDSVAVSGDTAVIGSRASYAGSSAYVFTRDASGNWNEQARLTTSNTYLDAFGQSVAVSGDTAVIGAFREDDSGIRTGSAYVFTPDASGAWTQQARLLATDGAADDDFGYSVAISGDTVVIGAIGDDDRGSLSGSAYVFTRDASDNWNEQAKLLASDGTTSGGFGQSVAVSGDMAVIGSYVFTRDASGSWTQQAKLLASDGTGDLSHARSVAVSGDTAVIGAPYDDDRGFYSGSAYVFELSDPDTDGDGIPDKDDACPLQDATGFDYNGDGCIDDIFGLQDMLQTLLDEGVISQDMQNSLLSKVDNALSINDKDNICASIEMLNSLINQIDAQRGKKISDDAANDLVNYTNSVIEALNSELPDNEECF